jgi:hypothetical protein
MADLVLVIVMQLSAFDEADVIFQYTSIYDDLLLIIIIIVLINAIINSMVHSPSEGANTSSASHRLPHILWNPNVYNNNNNNNLTSLHTRPPCVVSNYIPSEVRLFTWNTVDLEE